MSKLIRWETPFSDLIDPSAIALVNRDQNDIYAYPMEVIICNDLDAYPKFRVQFGQVIAFSAMEEMHNPMSYFKDVERDDNETCAYTFSDSPWVVAYGGGEGFVFQPDNGESLTHYVIFGGDDIVQVITKNDPVITVISEPMMLKIDFLI